MRLSLSPTQSQNRARRAKIFVLILIKSTDAHRLNLKSFVRQNPSFQKFSVGVLVNNCCQEPRIFGYKFVVYWLSCLAQHKVGFEAFFI